MTYHAFRAPGTHLTGPGALQELAPRLAAWGVERVFVVTDPGVVKAGLLERVGEQLRVAGVQWSHFADVEPDPAVTTCQRACDALRAFGAGAVIGLGGGSSMDVAKVACGAAAGSGQVMDYVSQPFVARQARLVQIPTTSGTGSEATDRGILTLADGHIKQGFLSPFLIADAAIVDPVLTLTVPPQVTASTGMDALTHAIEAYVSNQATPLTDALALAAIERIGRSLRKAVHQGSDLQARTDMSLASFWAGMAFNNGGLGVVHALAMSLGSHFPVPHGVANSVLLPFCIEFNVVADPVKFADVARALGEVTDGLSLREAAAKAVPAIFALAADCGIPSRLEQVGATVESIPVLAETGFAIKRLINTNPRRVALEDCVGILRRASGLNP